MALQQTLKLKDDHKHELPETVAAVKQAAADTGKSPLSLVADWWRNSSKRGKLTIFEYMQYQLYKASFTPEQKQAFISERLNWDIVDQVSGLHWRAATEDKFLSYQILGSLGVPVPETIAVADTSIRQYGDLPKLTNKEELEAFLTMQRNFPIFVKPNGELGSHGAFMIYGVENGELIVNGDERTSFAAIWDEAVSKGPYLFQACVTCHEDIRALTERVATIRTINLVDDDGLSTPYCLFKIPTGKNVADNFWRTGNLLANLDPETGKIVRVVSQKGLEIIEHETHPETEAPLIGWQVPHWKEVLELNRKCAENFAPVRYQSLDITVTDNGPLVIEINSGSSFVLPQLATGEGMMTEEIAGFFKKHGWE